MPAVRHPPACFLGSRSGYSLARSGSHAGVPPRPRRQENWKTRLRLLISAQSLFPVKKKKIFIPKQTETPPSRFPLLTINALVYFRSFPSLPISFPGLKKEEDPGRSDIRIRNVGSFPSAEPKFENHNAKRTVWCVCVYV